MTYSAPILLIAVDIDTPATSATRKEGGRRARHPNGGIR